MKTMPWGRYRWNRRRPLTMMRRIVRSTIGRRSWCQGRVGSGGWWWPRSRWWSSWRNVLAVRTTTVPATVGFILKALAVLFETERFPTFATMLVHPLSFHSKVRVTSSTWSRGVRQWWSMSRSQRTTNTITRRRHSRVPYRELFIKGCWVTFQNPLACLFNRIGVIRIDVTVQAFASRATGGR